MSASERRPRRAWFGSAPLQIALCLALSGCGLIPNLSPKHSADDERVVQLHEQQARVMRFADAFAARVYAATTTAEQRVVTPEDRGELESWRLGQITSAFIIATGQNPITNTLDVIVLTSLGDAAMRDYWLPKYGSVAQPLATAHARLEREAWTLGSQVLTPDQASELAQMITQWRSENPKLLAVGFIHFRDVSRALGSSAVSGSQVASSDKGGAGLLSMVGLDPLSNLDPAVRELTRDRLLAERAVYYGQRLPYLLDMQVNHVAYETAMMPESRQLLADVNEVSTSVARVTSTVNGLPQLISSERRAAINQIVSELDRQEGRARALLAEARSVLEAGTVTANALDRTTTSLGTLVTRFDKPDSRPKQPSKPFDIDQYTAAAAQLSQTARDLERLVLALGGTAPQLDETVRSTAAAGERVVDHAFDRAILLLLLALAGGLGVAVAYRYIALRLVRTR